MTRSESGGAASLPEEIDVLIVGGGQAGLGMGYRLRQAGVPFVIVDDRERVGDVWRARWRSLVLFTPRRFSALPGLPLPDSVGTYPTKDEIADYMEAFARQHALPIVPQTRVTSILRDDDREGRAFLTETTGGTVRSRAVVIATGPFQYPRVPRVAAGLHRDVVQVHSTAYEGPEDLPPGRIAVVGGGNSAAQLADELSASHEVTMIAPQKPWFIPERILGVTVYWPLKIFGILSSPADSAISEYIHSRGDGILGTQAQRAIRRGRMRLLTSRVVGAADRELELQDGTRVEVDGVLWGTGFRAHYPFVRIDEALTEHGAPLHDRGVSPVDGLYWIGLPWQRRLDSSIIHGIAADSRELAEVVRSRLRRSGRVEA
ncbi:MAG: NAD(P)/FAD-dependent oxidoreductase [Microcella sp.]|uniref:flavin-containing monooxygenase n=1 Tax=Microcella sp. TaxID=1913979 RepID=UPI00331475C5